MKSLILKSDSYKFTHNPQYPKGTTKVISYLESRGGLFDTTVFYGLQFLLKKHFEEARNVEKEYQTHIREKN